MGTCRAHSPQAAEHVPLRMRRRFSYLLAAEFALIVGCPALGYLGVGPPAWGILGIGVFVAALYATVGESRTSAIATFLAIMAVAGTLASILGHGRLFQIQGRVFGTAFLIFAAVTILRSVISAAKVTIDTLYAAVAAYVLLGLTWGAFYFLIETVWPASFNSPLMPGNELTGPDFVFFSFVTLTTIGYGDVIPAAGLAKSFVIIEAVTGIMYPAVMIARLIALHSADSATPGHSPNPQ